MTTPGTRPSLAPPHRLHDALPDCEAIALCGHVLAEQLPPGAEPANELPHRFFVI